MRRRIADEEIFLAVFLILVFLCSAGLIGYSWLVFQISRGLPQLVTASLRRRPGFFELAETPFRTVPLLSRILKDDYEKLTFAQVNVLLPRAAGGDLWTGLKRRSEVLPRSKTRGTFPSGWAIFSFAAQWRARTVRKALGYLKSALAEYQRGLAVAPEDWT